MLINVHAVGRAGIVIGYKVGEDSPEILATVPEQE